MPSKVTPFVPGTHVVMVSEKDTWMHHGAKGIIISGGPRDGSVYIEWYQHNKTNKGTIRYYHNARHIEIDEKPGLMNPNMAFLQKRRKR